MNETDFMAEPWHGPVWEGVDVEGEGVSLVDLSRRRRFGVKGPNAASWLSNQALPVSAENNRAEAANAVVTARLAPGEILLLAGETGGGIILNNLSFALDRDHPAGCYAVPRQDMSAWFRLTGKQAPRLMAELCAIDLRPHRFVEGFVAQTSVANHSAIVVRSDRKSAYGLDLLTDFSGAGYFWKVLAEKVDHWSGGSG
ncbi:MAG: hypothetical protein O7G83_21540 [Proteobacteria bacterium]|nr:hypothetical protein [Pseudomonadota bacterium]